MIESLSSSAEENKKVFTPRSIIIFVLIIGIMISGFYFWQKMRPTADPEYIYGYRLVNEKVSQSASIVINLPHEINKAVAQNNVKFDPEIKGVWLESEDEKKIVFKPEEQLNLNRYYSVQLTITQSEESTIVADFLAVEDPEITAIFPRENSEAPEDSEITIVFNRPMVPLTTLGHLEEKEVPVEILPATEGRFKWITTNNLQFIPEERLQRSSNYTVKIKSGLVSMDGLGLKGREIKFVTRILRYLNLSSGRTVYNRPISIHFNQPVDLEKTKREITLTDVTTGKEVPFIAEYAFKGERSLAEEERKVYTFKKLDNLVAGIASSLGFQIDFGRSAKEEDVNRSVIQIYNQKDRFGRQKFWDFENNYSLKINKAYPTEGDIILGQSRSTGIQVEGIIKDLTAESQRTRYASPDLFDPQGKIWVEFYEEIDLAKSRITASKLKETGYGEKCKDGTGSRDVECEKIEDKNKVYLIFKSHEIGLAERLTINFERVVNIEGLTVNREPFARQIISFPEFKILRTSPSDNSKDASLTTFYFCSNTPILVPAKEDYQKYFKANLDHEFNSWGASWRIDWRGSEEICNFGEFRTGINYGLIPLADYSLEFNLEDVFGQKLDFALKFATGKMPSEQLNFYHFQRPYNVASPQKAGLTYALRNMEYINLEICKLNPLAFLGYIEEKPSYYDSYIANCQTVARARIELPKRYWIRNYIKVNVGDYFEEPIGHYILTFSHPDYKFRYWAAGGDTYRQGYERTYLTVTNLAVAEKRILPQYAASGSREPLTPDQLSQLNNLYWVTDISGLQPISGAQINLYQKKELALAASYSTDREGLAFTEVIPDLRGAIISKGIDSTILPSRESRLDWADLAFSAQKFYLYTDKPLYRPGQEVFFKGIYRIGYDGNYEIYQDQDINFRVFNSRGDEILNQDLKVNDFGTFDTKLILDAGAPLGSYRACAKQYSCVYFDVLEYVPAPFEVKVNTDKNEYVSKDTVNLKIEANYYFGVSLEGGEVDYAISSQNYYFDRYRGDYFSFDRRWYYWSPYDYGEKFILRGKASLDSGGKAEISQLLDLEQLFREKEEKKSKIIIIDVTVKNPQGQTVSSQQSFVLHASEVYLGLKADKSFLAKNEKFNIRAKSVNTQGEEVAVRNITLNLYKTDWIRSRRLGVDGSYYYQWEEQRELVESHNFNTDSRGNFSKELQIAGEGSYEAEISNYDRRNNLVWSAINLYVYGPKMVSVRPTKETELEIEVEKSELSVGEEGKIIIKSPYQKARALISIERGQIFDYYIREIEGSLYNFSFKVEEEHVPNVFVSVLLLSSDPEIKFGKAEFKINTEQKELDIDVKSDKTHYLPGEEVTLDMSVKDHWGNPVSAELSLAIVDLSVLALKGNPKKNPVIFFYAGFPLTVSTASNIKDVLVEVEVSTKGGGGGGMVAEELAVKKRGVFRETAFWQAVVRTNEKGTAQVKFVLPDNLTTWQAEALGLTKDAKFGVDYIEFITRKELMVVPLRPRFVVPGDIFYVGAQIFNQSETTQGLTVSFESQTLLLEDDRPEKEIRLAAGKTETIYFRVQAVPHISKGEHVFLISAKGQGLEDTIELPISITPNNTYEVTAASNYTAENAAREYVFLPPEVVRDRGELTIKSSATLAVFLSDALNYLVQFPYGCSEQVASKLNAIAVVKRGLNLPNIAEKFNLEKIKYQDREYTIEEAVQIGLAELYNNQQYDGGFAFWRRGESNFFVTLHVVETLNNLSLAGFEINKNSLNRGSRYLADRIKSRLPYETEDTYRDRVISTAYTLFRLPDFKENAFLKQKLIEISTDDLFLNEKISNTALSYLAVAFSKDFNPALKNKVFTVLENRIDIDSRGAFLEIGNNFFWRYYETPIKNTALFLKALSADQRDIEILDKVVRWLLNSRKKDGAWGSTNNTVSVIDAFADFLQWRKETESDFLLELFINEKPEGDFDFNPETILGQLQKNIPLQELKFNEINTVSFLKTNRNNLPNNLYYDLSLRYYLPVEQIPPRDEGFSVVREIYSLNDTKNENPLREARVGEVLRVRLQITVPATRNYVAVEDFIPAGMEIVNLDLATEQKSLRLQERELSGRELIPDFRELRDDRAFLFKENLRPGVYEFDYYVRALIKGKFSHLPTVVSEMYFPENFGRTAGSYFEIK